jgi:ABC-2 type transport system ATP-binding protein
MTSALAFESVSLNYSAHTVIHDLNAAIPDGTVAGIVGLNGAGKTTLIKAVLGLREVSAGGVYVFGNAAGTAEAKRCLSYIPENFQPPELLNGYEFLYFASQFYHYAVDEQTILKYGNMLGMTDAVLSRRVRTYSKGMRQKLGIMGAVLTNARCLVLDEPMAGLDPAARIAVKDMLDMAHKQGKTIVLSSHILVDMDEICDTLLVIAENKLRFHGSPGELKQQNAANNLEKGFLALVGDGAA